jgi:hypothetical protein
MDLSEQEIWLIQRLKENHKEEDEIKKMLANVRKGYKYEAVTEVDRPDLLELKS